MRVPHVRREEAHIRASCKHRSARPVQVRKGRTPVLEDADLEPRNLVITLCAPRAPRHQEQVIVRENARAWAVRKEVAPEKRPGGRARKFGTLLAHTRAGL